MMEFMLLLLIVIVFGAVLLGIPVAFAIGGGSLLIAFIASLFGLLDLSILSAIPSRIFGTAMYNGVLTAVPLFILMGAILEKSKVAEDLLTNMARLSAGLPAGLGISVMLVGTLLAASTGIVGATVVAMGLLSLPTMLKHGYKPSFAAGTICASGTLGQIIPPSIVLVILADQLSNGYMQAQREIGNFAPDPISVADLFAGALIPGIGLALLYMLYQLAIGILRPHHAPSVKQEALAPITQRQLWLSILPPILLMILVLGSILFGIATPTEAAGIGALGATLLAGLKLSGALTQRTQRATKLILAALLAGLCLPIIVSFSDLKPALPSMSNSNIVFFFVAIVATALLFAGTFLAIYQIHKNRALEEALSTTLRISTLAFTILIGATIFSLVFRALGGEEIVLSIMADIPGGPIGAVIAVSILIFVLGFFLDFIEITFIVMPIVAPIILQSDINPIWFGVLIAMNLQTSFLTPPFGFALFYLRGAAPSSLKTSDIYKGVIPFIAIQIIALILVFTFPQLATWLPSVLVK